MPNSFAAKVRQIGLLDQTFGSAEDPLFCRALRSDRARSSEQEASSGGPGLFEAGNPCRVVRDQRTNEW